MNTDNKIPMTGAELQMMRAACGLTRQNVADFAGVKLSSAKYFETGRGGVPDDVADWIAETYEGHLLAVAHLVRIARAAHTKPVILPMISGLDPDSPTSNMAQAITASASVVMNLCGDVVLCAKVDASQCLDDDERINWQRACVLAKNNHHAQAMQHKNSGT
jgi:DNA-binding XRE family transcriptional regulator